MKKEWSYKKLNKVCKVERGSSPRPIKEYLTTDSSGVNWIKIGDTKNVDKYIFSTKEKITIEGAKKSRYVKEGDFILSNSMSFGKPYIMKTDGFIHDGWFVLRLNENINSEFFWYLLSSPVVSKQFNMLASGAIVKNISSDLVKKVVLPIPPIPEQQRIVEILDQAFAAIDQAIANTEKNLQNAQELFDSYLNSVFIDPPEYWKSCELNDHVKFIDYRGHTPNKIETGMRLITAKNVKLGYLKNEPEEFVDPNIYDSWMVRGIPRKGDVLFTTEAPLANVAQLDTDEKVLFAQRIIILQPNENKLDQTYLKYLLLSSPIRRKIFENGTGATVKGIKAKLLKKIKIYFPEDILIQKKIVQELDSMWSNSQSLQSNYKQKLTNLHELKQSILQKAFNGELT
ncbi:MAG: type I restriction endonuclease subunit S [Anaerolineaceae bacterium]|nr:type I restriction endonuclease subunit S [Anaerolineaceae bacterium]